MIRGNFSIKKADGVTAVLCSLFAVVFLAAFIATFGMPKGAALMPRAISGFGLILCLFGVGRFILSGSATHGDGGNDMGEGTDVTPLGALRYGLWMIAYLAGLWLFGLIIATVAFTVAFLHFERGARWHVILFMTAFTLVTAILLGRLMMIQWPSGILINI